MSIPLIGYAPFLLITCDADKCEQYCVNSLNRVRSISTFMNKITLATDNLVSIPLIGYAPFLLFYNTLSKRVKKAVSIPLIGYAPFLLCPSRGVSKPYGCVNSLNRVRSISTCPKRGPIKRSALCVNSLNRVRSISTYMTTRNLVTINVCQFP